MVEKVAIYHGNKDDTASATVLGIEGIDIVKGTTKASARAIPLERCGRALKMIG